MTETKEMNNSQPAPLSKEAIRRLADGIKVIAFDGKYRSPRIWKMVEYPKVDPFTESCTWKKPEPVMMKVKKVLGSYDCKHTIASPVFFKPTLAEVIHQMPVNMLGEVNAVHIKYNGFAPDAKHHLSIVTAYEVEPMTEQEQAAVLHRGPNENQGANVIHGLTPSYRQAIIDHCDRELLSLSRMGKENHPRYREHQVFRDLLEQAPDDWLEPEDGDTQAEDKGYLLEQERKEE